MPAACRRESHAIPLRTPAQHQGQDRGRKDRAGRPVSPPSEPHVRISRIRLSGRWFTAERTDLPDIGSPGCVPTPDNRALRSIHFPRGKQSAYRWGQAKLHDSFSGRFSPKALVLPVILSDPLHAISTFLHPLAPPALPGFIATMGALTPAGRSFLGCRRFVRSAWPRRGPAARPFCAWSA